MADNFTSKIKQFQKEVNDFIIYSERMDKYIFELLILGCEWKSNDIDQKLIKWQKNYFNGLKKMPNEEKVNRDLLQEMREEYLDHPALKDGNSMVKAMGDYFHNSTKAGVLLTYAYTDSMLQKLCNLCSTEKKSPVKVSQFKFAESDFKTYLKYLEVILETSMDDVYNGPGSCWLEYKDLISIRNALAHNDSFFDGNGNFKKKFEQTILRYGNQLQKAGTDISIGESIVFRFRELSKYFLFQVSDLCLQRLSFLQQDSI